MPRPSNTYERVFETADQLLEQGVRPTQQKIREELGSGSISTINKALGDWWQQLGQRLKSQREVPGLPDPVAETTRKLWQQALAYAERSFKDQSEAFAEQLREQSAEVQQQAQEALQQADALRSHNERLMQENERLMSERCERDERIQELETRLIVLMGENEDQQRELKQQKILARNGEAGRPEVSAEFNEQLMQLQIELKVKDRSIEQLTERLQSVEQENSQLRRERYEVEQEALKRQHGLELVIAQQDVRYEESQRLLKRYQAVDEEVASGL